MHGTYRWLMGLVLLIGVWSIAEGAVIVTTRGETIVCTIIRETETYFIVDHEGYRRYVLKSHVRSIDRESGGDLNASILGRTVSLYGGVRLYGHQMGPGFSGGRIAVGYPLNDVVQLEVNVHHHRGRADSTYEGYGIDLLSGPLTWTGVTVGAIWHLQQWRIRPTFEAGAGYFVVDHRVDQREAEWVKSYFEEGTILDYSQPTANGFGVSVGVGAYMPISRRFAVSMRAGFLVIHSEYVSVFTVNTEEGPVVIEDFYHGLLLRAFQTHLGVTMRF